MIHSKPHLWMALAIVAPISAQAFTWRLETPAHHPANRYSAVMAHDSARGKTMLFGGYHSGTSTTFGDFWAWDGSDWFAVFCQHYPSARWMSAMVYDSDRQCLVLFGGYGPSPLMSDTWEFDGVDWVQRVVSPAPAGRFDHAMAYDSGRQRTVLFGGYVSQSGTLSNQTWEWDGTLWRLRTPVNSPSARYGASMAYDPIRQRVVLFGGKVTNPLSDTWEWDGTNWEQRASGSGPLLGGRYHYGMAFDEVRQRVVLWGGKNNSTPGPTDTEEWTGTSWLQASPAASPSARESPAMAFNTQTQRMVLTGGTIGGGETWTRGQFGTVGTATPFGAGCGAPALELSPAIGQPPVIGQSGGAILTNVPTVLAGMAIGWSRTQYGPFSLPVTLGGIGMQGCDLLQSSNVIGLTTAPIGAGTAAFATPIPNELALVGTTVYLQGYAYAPGVNTLEMIVSNGLEWFVGDL